MTIASTTSKVSYNGAGTTGPFSITFKFAKNADIVATRVSAAGVETTETGYTLTGAGEPSGGTLTLGTALASGEKLIIKRSPSIVQETDYVENAAFPAETHEAALDLLTMIAQDLQEQIDRAVLVPISSSTSPADLLDELEADVATAVASAATATTQAGLANTARIAAESSAAFLSGLEAYQASTYGASTSSTDNATAIQAGIDALTALGGGFLDFGSGTYTTGPLVLKSNVILRGQGLLATTLKLKDGSDADFIVSENFASLTGQNKMLTTDGLVSGCGFSDIGIDGNKANQSAGDGVKIYGKRLYVQNTAIYDAYGVGWYSEAGTGSFGTGIIEHPETNINNVIVRNCGSHGFQYRGPHDASVDKLYVSLCGGDGVRIEMSSGVYNGSCDIGFIHEYACTGYGFFSDVGTQFRCRQLISESNYKEGLYYNGTASQFGMVQLYNNCRTSGDFQAVFTENALNTAVGSIQVQHSWPGGMTADIGGLDILGYGNDISGFECNGSSGSGTGLRIHTLADRNCITGNIYGFTEAGGLGLETGYGGASNDNELNLSIAGNATQWKNTTAGYRNIYAIAMRCTNGSGQLLMDAASVAPNTINDIEVWDVVGIDQAGAYKKSSFAASLRTTAITLGTAGATSTTFAHGLLFAPELDHVAVSAKYAGTNATWILGQPFHVSSIDATNVVIRNRVSTASGTAKNITGATKANPCVITAVAHGFANGNTVVISGVGGMTQLNGNVYTVANKADDTFELSGINSTGYGEYTTGGTACPDYIQIAVQARL